MLGTDAALLRNYLLEDLLILNLCMLPFLGADVYMDIAVADVPVSDHQKPGVLGSKGFDHFLPFCDIE